MIVAVAKPVRFRYKTSVISLYSLILIGNVINKVIILNTNHNSLSICIVVVTIFINIIIT